MPGKRFCLLGAYPKSLVVPIHGRDFIAKLFDPGAQDLLYLQQAAPQISYDAFLFRNYKARLAVPAPHILFFIRELFDLTL
jgi:hypothetical protein